MPLSSRDKANWAACLALKVAIAGSAALWLRGHGLTLGEGAQERVTSVPLLVFHTLLAIVWTVVLLLVFLNPIPLDVHYFVMGRPEIPVVDHIFRNAGRWTTFTLWCNTVALIYFWLAAFSDAWQLRQPGTAPPWPVSTALLCTWGVILPTSFEVNLVVTYTLIPAIKKAALHDKLDFILHWRSLWLHNGFCLATAAEVALVSPSASVQNFPIVVFFCTGYVGFAWVLFFRTGVFHYYFLDPRFKYAPLAMLALYVLLTSLYLGLCVLVKATATSSLLGGLLIVAALSTCTWRSPPGEPLDGLGSVTRTLRLFGYGTTPKAKQ